MEELKKGDIVKLKSGSLEMTVSEVDAYGGVAVVWFSENKLHREGLNKEVLIKV